MKARSERNPDGCIVVDDGTHSSFYPVPVPVPPACLPLVHFAAALVVEVFFPQYGGDTLQSIWRRSWLPLSGAALLAGFLGLYIVGTAAASARPRPCCDGSREHAKPTGRPPALTGDNAEQFDKELDWPEWWMGITALRKRLAARARGNVLELAVGTGRNLEYYDWRGLGQAPSSAASGVTSFTGLDISDDMLGVARNRLVKTVAPIRDSEPVAERPSVVDDAGGQASFVNNRVRLVRSDAHDPIPPVAAAAKSPARATYDTIVQTFGLCSVSDPVAVLCNLASAVKPDSGRILLLEHGKGWYGIVNGLLDKNAAKHFAKYGCWWNRDVEALVQEAVKRTPGLEVVRLDRPNVLQMGTLVWVELRMRPKAA
ncbi:hypothetical protein UVI_02027700 [Ustilaginoidea virens]|uniref:Ubiquinone/menaquinone biosynthesis-related protein n=1 Tax=Ustilaginoidea virens TaxID=1159556 RepID=A0A1B5KVK1_USTVR|nr:hypothetical protein UVI_02027700 [Ustilaginoidea virens]